MSAPQMLCTKFRMLIFSPYQTLVTPEMEGVVSPCYPHVGFSQGRGWLAIYDFVTEASVGDPRDNSGDSHFAHISALKRQGVKRRSTILSNLTTLGDTQDGRGDVGTMMACGHHKR